jgi:hypothetical protein
LLDLRHLLLHLPAKFRIEPGVVQLLYGRLCQIEPTRARLGMMQLPVRAPMAVLGSMVCFAVPMLLTIGRLTVPLRFVFPMLHAVTVPSLL